MAPGSHFRSTSGSRGGLEPQHSSTSSPQPLLRSMLALPSHPSSYSMSADKSCKDDILEFALALTVDNSRNPCTSIQEVLWQVYEGAAAAYASLAQHLEELYPAASDVHFFLGDAPSTVDAVVYPHLLYHLRSPVAAPELRTQVPLPPLPLWFVYVCT